MYVNLFCVLIINMSKNEKLSIIFGILIGIMGAYILKRVFFEKKETIVKITATKIQSETPQMELLEKNKTFFGVLNSQLSTTLSAEIVGRVTFIHSDGSFVNKGDVIVKLQNDEAIAKYQSAQSKAQEEQSKLEQTQKLFNEGYASAIHLEVQKSRHESALSEALYALANLKKHTITAPFSGIIGLQNHNIGSIVNYNTKLVTITNLDNMFVEFVLSDASLKEINGLQALKNAKIFVYLPNNTMGVKAKFAAYDTLMEKETNAMKIRLKLENFDKTNVACGQKCKIVCVFSNDENVMTVSESAIQEMYGNYYVFRIEKGTAIRTIVTIGEKQNGRVEIVTGLQNQDVIISSGLYKIFDGMKVSK